MSAHRTDMHRIQELVRLHRLGRSTRDVARILGMGRDTIRTYSKALAEAGLLEGDGGELPGHEALQAAVRGHIPAPPARKPQPSSVEPFQEEIDRQRRKGAMPTAIHE